MSPGGSFVSIQTVGKIILHPTFSILECGEDILKFIVINIIIIIIIIIILIVVIIIIASKQALFTCVGVPIYFHFQTFSSYICKFYCVVTLSVAQIVASNVGMITEQWIGKDMEGRGNVLIEGTIETFA